MKARAVPRWRHLMGQFWQVLRQFFRAEPPLSPAPALEEAPAAYPGPYEPMRRLTLTDGVARSLFEEFAQHRREERGEEETGWVLLGLRNREEAIALATLPAGAHREAGWAHVRFNDTAQAVAARVIRQQERRLVMLGVVHTHPGSLRRPSGGDFEGDSVWVNNLRGKEGAFGIGTADATPAEKGLMLRPRPNMQVLGELCFSWYALKSGDRNYRPLEVDITIGPDLARPLHQSWPALEAHAARLDRLLRQQPGATLNGAGEKLLLTVPLAGPRDAIHVTLGGDRPEAAEYVVLLGGQAFGVNPGVDNVEQAVYLLMAELAARA